MVRDDVEIALQRLFMDRQITWGAGVRCQNIFQPHFY